MIFESQVAATSPKIPGSLAEGGRAASWDKNRDFLLIIFFKYLSPLALLGSKYVMDVKGSSNEGFYSYF